MKNRLMSGDGTVGRRIGGKIGKKVGENEFWEITGEAIGHIIDR